MANYPINVYAALHLCKLLGYEENLKSLHNKKKEASLASTIKDLIISSGHEPIDANPYSQLDAFFNETEVKKERRRIITMFRERGLVQVIRAITHYESTESGVETIASSRVYLVVNGKVKHIDKAIYEGLETDSDIEEKIITLYDNEIDTFNRYSFTTLSYVVDAMFDIVPKGQKHEMVKTIMKLVDGASQRDPRIMRKGKYCCTQHQKEVFESSVIQHAVDSYFAYLNGEEGKDMQYVLGFTSFIEKYMSSLLALEEIQKKLVLWHEFHQTIFETLASDDYEVSEEDNDLSELFSPTQPYLRCLTLNFYKKRTRYVSVKRFS